MVFFAVEVASTLVLITEAFSFRQPKYFCNLPFLKIIVFLLRVIGIQQISRLVTLSQYDVIIYITVLIHFSIILGTVGLLV